MAESPDNADRERKGAGLVLLCLIVATFLKMLWASHSIGSVDSMLFFGFAADIKKSGLKSLYEEDYLFNHTPLTSAVISGLYQYTEPENADALVGKEAIQAAGLHVQDFSFLLRVLPIFADIAIVLALLACRGRLGGPPWWALAVFALSPVSLMVSGFHGNIDAIMTAFLLLAVLATVTGRPVLSAVLFVLACNVKVVPLPFSMLFFFYWLPRGAAWRYTAVVTAGVAAGFAWGLITCPTAFLRNVFGYGSSWGTWGIPLGLRATGWEVMQPTGFQNLTNAEKGIMSVLKVIIIGGIAWIGWRRRNVSAVGLVTTFAAAWVWLFVFAPGVGVQYFAWLAPFLLIAAPRAFALHLITATVFLASFYHASSNGQFPWTYSAPKQDHIAWLTTGGVCWFVLAGILVAYAKEWMSPAAMEGVPISATPADQSANELEVAS